VAFSVRTLAATYYDGHHIAPHAHPWGQLIYAAEGVMRVSAGAHMWVVPPARAVWAPPGVAHEIHAQGTFKMRTLYLEPAISNVLPGDCIALEVSPLLRELVLHIVQLQMLDGANVGHTHLIGVLLDRLRAAETLPLSIRMPTDRRALAVAVRLQRDPTDTADLAELAAAAGASVRTLQRVFLIETGLGFAQWRQRLRLLHAVAKLSMGATVTEAGQQAGYANTSAFIAAFRKQLGQTPMRYRDLKPSRAPS
jgi:AraC-like DNA-binding protein